MSFQRYKPLRRKTPMKRSSVKFKKTDPSAIRSAGIGSKLEAAVRELYREREERDEISGLKFQPLVYFSCGMRWRPDGVYYCHTRNAIVWFEAKGIGGKNYRTCLNLWRDGYGPGPLELWKGDYRRPVLVETIIPKARVE